MSKTRTALWLLVLLLALPQPLPARAAGYQGYAGYKYMNVALSREQCLAASSRIMLAAGYTLDPVGAGESALWAGRNNEVVIIICAMPGNLVTTFVHSPQPAEPPGLFQRIEEGLRAAAAGRMPAPPKG